MHQALGGPRTGREWLRLVGLDLSLDLLAGQGSRKARAKAEGAGDLPGDLCGQRLGEHRGWTGTAEARHGFRAIF